MVCPQCEGEGYYADGLDESACSTECTRCGSNGWIVDLARLAAAPAYTPRPVEGEVDRLRHKLWMVACHATGGGIPKIEGIDRSTNEICVQITASRNAIYQAGKDAALARPVKAGAGKLAEDVADWMQMARDAAASVRPNSPWAKGVRGGRRDYDSEVLAAMHAIAAVRALTTPAGGIAEGGSAVVAAAQFLSDRLDDLEWMDGALEDTLRDYMGHVDPAHDRLKSALAATAPDLEKGA